jgi:diaminohydroxyphosphoribosylaminopyrimidine deaminase/5-amino-6-(5-phosphoribosylamino)uracil reductase
VREVETPRQPLKVIIDSRLQTPADARVLEGGNVLIACAQDDAEARARLEARGCEVLLLPNANGKVELIDVMRELGRRKLNEIHVEAGFKLNGSLLREGCIDELLLYLAPSILGDGAQGMFNLPTLTQLDARIKLKLHKTAQVGPDLRLLVRTQTED